MRRSTLRVLVFVAGSMTLGQANHNNGTLREITYNVKGAKASREQEREPSE